MKKIKILAICIQNDFCDPRGSVYIQNADKDVERCNSFIRKMGSQIDDILVVLESRNKIDISHEYWWIDENILKSPPPFTQIKNSSNWIARNPADREHARNYLQYLEANGLSHTIWPEHCIIGTHGSNLVKSFSDTINSWSFVKNKNPKYFLKGMNPLTAHESSIKPEYIISNQPNTHLNVELLSELNIDDCEHIYVMGQASSHCVARTMLDFYLSDHVTYLSDCCSPMPGFEDTESIFLETIRKAGVKIQRSVDIT